MSKKVLITGGTGFLGFYLVRRFLQDKDVKVILLVRRQGSLSAPQRVERLLKERYSEAEYHRIRPRVEIVEGSITSPDFGLSKKHAERLSREVTVIFHSAALAQFNVSYERIKKINVEGTKNILDFALQCLKNGSFESVNHISTVAVAGAYHGTFYEDSLDKGQYFKNTYEQTKFEAEQLVHAYRTKGLNVNIFRPSAIVGDSQDGYAINFRVIYQPIHIFSLGIYKQIPADGGVNYNLIPVDSVADAIYRIHAHTHPCNETFHLTNTHDVTGDFIFKTASDFFGYPDPERIPLENFDMSTLKGARRLLLEPYIPYFNHNGVKYDNRRAMNILKKNGFEWPQIDRKLLHTIFKFCLDAQFITPQDRILL
ncbi:MAG: SDR family oxidoreductase [Pseudomonadota bacterium]